MAETTLNRVMRWGDLPKRLAQRGTYVDRHGPWAMACFECTRCRAQFVVSAPPGTGVTCSCGGETRKVLS